VVNLDLILIFIILFILLFLTAALYIPLKLSFFIIVLVFDTFNFGFLFLLIIFKLIKVGHGSVLFINSFASLIHLLYEIEFFRLEGRLESIINLHFLQLFRHSHEARVRVDL